MTLAEEIDKKFPEFSGLRIRYREEKHTPIPYIFRLIASAALNPNGPSCAFIVPQPEMTAYFAALLAALSDTKQHFQKRREEFASTGLMTGTNVQILPSRKIYEYAGIKTYAFRSGGPVAQVEPRFVLKLLGQQGTVSLPMSDILRLLPTDRTTPYGRGATITEQMVLSDLDRLLDIQSYGNLSVFRNKIILQSSKSQIEGFMTDWDICNEKQTAVLKDLSDLPWGTINSSGKLINADSHQICGSPVIAFANRLSPIDGYCSAQSEKSRTVISFSRNAVLKDSYDAGRIGETQKLILITDYLDEKECDELRNNGIEIWKPEKDEVFLGLDNKYGANDLKHSTPIRKFLVAAGVSADSVTLEIAHSTVFQELCDGIAALRRQIEDRDAKNAVTEGLQRVLWRSSELFSLPNEEYKTWLMEQVKGIEKSLTDYSAYIKKDLVENIRNLVTLITQEFLPNIERHSQEKLDKLEALASPGKKIIILTRHTEAGATLRKRMSTNSAQLFFQTYAEIGSLLSEKDADFEFAVMVGWPGKHLFLELLQAGIAKNIRAVLYPHESRILNNFFRQSKKIDKKLSPSPETKENISGIPAAFFTVSNIEEPESYLEEMPPEEQKSSLRISDSDDIFNISWFAKPSSALTAGDGSHAVKARLISLGNDTCLYLSEDHHVSVITSGTHEYRRKTVDELAVGDVIVFRNGSEKELIREVAASIYGDRYEQLWETASLWKTWLKSLGNGPTEIWQKLITAGLNRHIVTIAQWLTYDDRIGPQNLNDILVIAQATGNENNLKNAARTADAIKQIRGIHVEAGFKLTAIVMENLAKGSLTIPRNSEIAAKFSDVRLFKVEDVDDHYQNVPASLVNNPHPLWYLDGFSQLMKDVSNG